MQKSTWTETAEAGRTFPALKGNLEAGIAIIGGGLAGILTAYLLAREGKDVIVLEKDRVGGGATSLTTAFITQDIDTDLTDLIRWFGEDTARLVWQSHAEAITAIEKIIKTERIDCEFARIPAFIYATEEKDVPSLQNERDSAATIGFRTILRRKPNLGFDHAGYWEIPKQAKYHPLKFLFALRDRCEALGVRIYEKTEVREIRGEGPVTVKTKNGEVVAEKAILATYYPFGNPKKTFAKKGMYVSYVFEAEIPKGGIPEGIYLDLDNPYHYFRIDPLRQAQGKPSKDRMIFGGEDHRSELKMAPRKNFSALLAHAKAVFPDMKFDVVRRWQGPILEPSDGLALIGGVKPNQYVATAFSGNGMTYSMISGLLLRDLILGKPSLWAELYDPKRRMKPRRLLRKAIDYGEEFVKGAVRNTFRGKQA